MKGHAIKLAVTGDSRNGILHIRHVPLQCVHRGFTRSATTTESRYVNHYFVQCPLKTDCGWRLG
ncbi:hypothetical protein MtrunA17_Chr6g0473641 [Medicago truncatula]|nr:hypothetical protein MtrunA17_Chr6g0473641 [Medicago truncatula]